MTASSTTRPAATMTTATRPSRLTTYTMGNGTARDDRPSQSSIPSFSSTSVPGWQAGIWAPNPIGSSLNSAARREATGSTRDSEDKFTPNLTGSGALAATSEADSSAAWPNRSGHWPLSDAAQGRPASGNTSPNHSRDPTAQQSLNDLSASSFFGGTRAQQHQNNFTPRPKTNGTLDPAAPLRYGSVGFNDMSVEDSRETAAVSSAAPFGSIGGPRLDRPRGQGGDYLSSVIGAPSRENSLPPSRHGEADVHHQAFGESAVNGFSSAAAAFGTHTPSSTVSQQRPSLPSHAQSFPSQTNSRAYNMNSQLDDDELSSTFARATLQGSIDSSTTNGLSLTNATQQPFQFNPGSRPWNAASDAFQNSDPLVSQHPMTSRNSVDRSSPAGIQYRNALSPQTYANTPTSAVDSWSRPGSSRDPRFLSDFERNRVLQQQQYYTQHTQFFPSYYPPPGFPQQYGPSPYDPYAAPHPNFRSQMPLPPYGAPLPGPPYMPTGPASSHPHHHPQSHQHHNSHNHNHSNSHHARGTKDQDQSQGVRSLLLEEFRNAHKNRKFELKEIYNHIVEFSGDQHGSRFIQGKLESANSDEKEQVFREIEPNAIQLMKDVFGNYVIQKFFEHGNQVQKKILAGVMKGKMVDLSCQMYSCRVVQKAMEHVLVEQQADLVAELKVDVVRIIKDQNGNHVIQKVIECVPRRYIEFIMSALRGTINQMASHSYGCRVVQRLLEHGSEDDKVEIMREIHACAQFLVTDQYGNYVTQHVLVHGKDADRTRMIAVVVPQLLNLSKHKFASNVVEKCIQFSEGSDRTAILEQMYRKCPDGTSPLQLLVKDQYGNYVIQKFLTTLKGAELSRFVDELRPCILSMKKVSTGRTVNALDKLMQLADKALAGKLTNEDMPSAPSGPSDMVPSAPSGPSRPTVLQIDPHSAVPTPVLTREPNTPLSSNPPSTHVSGLGDSIMDEPKVDVNGAFARQLQVENGESQ